MLTGTQGHLEQINHYVGTKRGNIFKSFVMIVRLESFVRPGEIQEKIILAKRGDLCINLSCILGMQDLNNFFCFVLKT